ncbi:hypothetical protein RYZ26_02565 [Terasakiella sp. A23]|uniref:hypothetical protein n=1 Tax=Terasakiella sp. FCG-A23 TaxID=3080561 RepID=UPI0029547AA3|nr:hypothetical protein [Terasakiella sp. A23]MDV7338463.1 hypothetical protein [Terasakiella sp. A23]
MTALIFDTHVFVKKLVGAGMPEAQAEVLAAEQTRLIDEQLATKQDLKHLELQMRTDLKQIEQSITIRTGAMILALGGFLAGIKFFA